MAFLDHERFAVSVYGVLSAIHFNGVGKYGLTVLFDNEAPG
jgi:hypothetical protein